jgi:hypothetical protein
MENTGKMILIGSYTGDIIVPVEGFTIPKLAFLFTIDTPLAERPKHIDFELQFPGDDEPIAFQLEVDEPLEVRPEHTRWYLRQIVGTQNRPLRLGRIRATVVCDGEAIDMSAPWITLAPGATPSADPTASPPPS